MSSVGACLSLDEALDDRRVIPPNNGLPEIILEAPTIREIIPVVKRFAEESAKKGNFGVALDEAAVECLMLTVRYPEDPEKRITKRRAELLLARQSDEPTPRAAWRTALNLADLVDMDALDEAIKKEAARPKKRRRKAGEPVVPKDDSPSR